MRRILPTLLLLLLIAPLAQAQSLVVLESSLPAYAAGATVQADAALNLPDKSRLVLVSEDGNTIALAGPFQGTAKSKMTGGGGNATFATALASLVRSTQEDKSSVGAVRAAGIGTREEALMVNLSESGDYCVTDPASLLMTRYKHETAPKITIVAPQAGLSLPMTWPTGRDRAPWPASMKADDGAVFLIDQEGKDSRTMITLHRMSGTYPTLAHEAVSMAEAGCTEQAKMLLALLRRQTK